MPNPSIAEWLLRRVTTQERAASITGDLIEQHAQGSSIAFWSSLAVIALSLSWRWLLAFVVASQIGTWTFHHLVTFTGTGTFGAKFFDDTLNLNPHFTGHLRTSIFVLYVVGSFLWKIALFLAIRYGLSDTMARFAMALVFGVIFVLALANVALNLADWWAKPVALVACTLTTFACIVLSLLTPQRRKITRALAGTLFVTALATVVGIFMSMFIFFLSLHYLQTSMTPKTVALIAWFLFNVLSFLITVSACTTMHDRMFPKDAIEI